MKLLVVIAVLALVVAPLGGTHLHLSNEGGFAGIHDVHIHDASVHADETDLLLTDSTVAMTKVVVFATFSLLFFALALNGQHFFSSIYSEHNPDDPIGLRPRLRAPPQNR